LGLLATSLSYEGHPWSLPADPPEVWTLEAGSGQRRNHWRGSDIDAVALALQDAVLAAELAGRQAVVLPYSPNRRQESVLALRSPLIRLAANPRSLLDGLHDKIRVRAALREIGVPVPASLAVHRSEPRLAAAIDTFGLPFVAQTRSGFGGKGTFLIREPADLAAALAEKSTVEQWLLSAYVGDLTVNFAAVVDARGQVSVAPPAIQLNDAGGPDGFGNYGGNDFAAAQDIDAAVLRLGERWTSRIGSWLAAQGFLGMFGVDYVLADGALNAIEVNPRMQASSALLGEIELEHGVAPSAVRHLLAFLGEDCEPPVMSGGISGAQLALREHGGSKVVSRAPQPGRYSVVEGRLVRHAPADGLLECGAHEVVVVGVPCVGTLLSDGATLARVITRERLVDAAGVPLPSAQALTSAVRAAFDFAPARDFRPPHGFPLPHRTPALLGRVT
jgi:glutathione synthase/RimK-type ligase-like ATP-grasp enzyme